MTFLFSFCILYFMIVLTLLPSWIYTTNSSIPSNWESKYWRAYTFIYSLYMIIILIAKQTTFNSFLSLCLFDHEHISIDIPFIRCHFPHQSFFVDLTIFWYWCKVFQLFSIHEFLCFFLNEKRYSLLLFLISSKF